MLVSVTLRTAKVSHSEVPNLYVGSWSEWSRRDVKGKMRFYKFSETDEELRIKFLITIKNDSEPNFGFLRKFIFNV